MNEFTKDSSTTILINEAVKKHKSIVPSMLDAHALVGCDSVPKLFGIAKIKVINALKSVSLSVFGNPESLEAEYMDFTKRFYCKMLWCRQEKLIGKWASNMFLME